MLRAEKCSHPVHIAPPPFHVFSPTRLFSEWYRPICFRHLSNRTIPGLPLSRSN